MYKNKKQVLEEFAKVAANLPHPPNSALSRRLTWEGYLHVLEMRKEVRQNCNWVNPEYVSGKPKRVRKPKPELYPLSVVKEAYDYGRGWPEEKMVTDTDEFMAFHLPVIIKHSND